MLSTDLRAEWALHTPSGAVDACANLGPSVLPKESRCSMPGGGTEAAVQGSIGAVLGRFAAEAATPVRISCALLYWSVLLEMTTVGSLYSRYKMSFCRRKTFSVVFDGPESGQLLRFRHAQEPLL